jgi:midasin (ATPase involved in ribosome maturation)
MEESPFFS